MPSLFFCNWRATSLHLGRSADFRVRMTERFFKKGGFAYFCIRNCKIMSFYVIDSDCDGTQSCGCGVITQTPCFA